MADQNSLNLDVVYDAKSMRKMDRQMRKMAKQFDKISTVTLDAEDRGLRKSVQKIQAIKDQVRGATRDLGGKVSTKLSKTMDKISSKFEKAFSKQPMIGPKPQSAFGAMKGEAVELKRKTLVKLYKAYKKTFRTATLKNMGKHIGKGVGKALEPMFKDLGSTFKKVGSKLYGAMDKISQFVQDPGLSGGPFGIFDIMNKVIDRIKKIPDKVDEFLRSSYNLRARTRSLRSTAFQGQGRDDVQLGYQQDAASGAGLTIPFMGDMSARGLNSGEAAALLSQLDQLQVDIGQQAGRTRTAMDDMTEAAQADWAAHARSVMAFADTLDHFGVSSIAEAMSHMEEYGDSLQETRGHYGKMIDTADRLNVNMSEWISSVMGAQDALHMYGISLSRINSVYSYLIDSTSELNRSIGDVGLGLNMSQSDLQEFGNAILGTFGSIQPAFAAALGSVFDEAEAAVDPLKSMYKRMGYDVGTLTTTRVEETTAGGSVVGGQLATMRRLSADEAPKQVAKTLNEALAFVAQETSGQGMTTAEQFHAQKKLLEEQLGYNEDQANALMNAVANDKDFLKKLAEGDQNAVDVMGNVEQLAESQRKSLIMMNEKLEAIEDALTDAMLSLMQAMTSAIVGGFISVVRLLQVIGLNLMNILSSVWRAVMSVWDAIGFGLTELGLNIELAFENLIDAFGFGDQKAIEKIENELLGVEKRRINAKKERDLERIEEAETIASGAASFGVAAREIGKTMTGVATNFIETGRKLSAVGSLIGAAMADVGEAIKMTSFENLSEEMGKVLGAMLPDLRSFGHATSGVTLMMQRLIDSDFSDKEALEKTMEYIQGQQEIYEKRIQIEKAVYKAIEEGKSAHKEANKMIIDIGNTLHDSGKQIQSTFLDIEKTLRGVRDELVEFQGSIDKGLVKYLNSLKGDQVSALLEERSAVLENYADAYEDVSEQFFGEEGAFASYTQEGFRGLEKQLGLESNTIRNRQQAEEAVKKDLASTFEPMLKRIDDAIKGQGQNYAAILASGLGVEGVDDVNLTTGQFFSKQASQQGTDEHEAYQEYLVNQEKHLERMKDMGLRNPNMAMRFAQGGMVPGSSPVGGGKSKGEILNYNMPGEFLIKTQSTRKMERMFPGLLSAINKNGPAALRPFLESYRNGGSVGGTAASNFAGSGQLSGQSPQINISPNLTVQGGGKQMAQEIQAMVDKAMARLGQDVQSFVVQYTNQAIRRS